jgi:hypothetical protein
MIPITFRHLAIRSLSILATVLASITAPRAVAAQLPPPHRVLVIEDDDRSGPRFGFAYLTNGSVTAEKQGKKLGPITTLFGWQFEHPFDAGPDLPTPMMEVVILVGGLEQGIPLPSASVLLALRQLNGVEFGVGPTLTGAGTQLAVAGGITSQVGRLNVPVNIAVAPGRRGASLSLTAGFNYR